MKKLPLIGILGTLSTLTSHSHATLSTWQTEVTAVGAVPAATVFTPVSGAAPILTNVGTLSGDRSFEFIVNSTAGGISQALIGSQEVASGRQGLKFEQWNNTGMYGMTNFGVTDFTSTVPYDIGRDVHLLFTSAGAGSTKFYVDTELTDTEVQSHFNSFALVPEPGVSGLALAGGLIPLLRRRRR